MSKKRPKLTLDKRRFAACTKCDASTVHEPHDITEDGKFDIYRCWKQHVTKIRRS